ncbi:AAA family ATPase [Kutzneria buriramensis]|uniref:Regulatory LuxR family protein n=1 Tax=Kutzneria buriramensis TaxID=1045776 RepID=A0A3E0H7L6_9PSEU|nr:LuxR family transcriptional regulator [Kutzneria buriramensis]REH39420.1 regulatory LuxR family protein [Kutzneria buriramensis]
MNTQLVGRRTELAALTGAVEAAADGRGGVLVISGQAGIGKTRLGEHAVDEARRRGFTTLIGQADPLQTGLAYGPIVAALRRHLDTLPETELATELDGLPDLGRLIPHPLLPTPSPASDPELERTRMFEAVRRLMERLTAKAPTMLLVDDLHWADRGTVELLHYLGRDTVDRRLLVIGAHRTAAPGSALADLAVSVRRQPTGRELALDVLSDDEVAEMLGNLLDAPPSPELLSDVTARSHGVPLFISALAPRGSRTQWHIVRDVVLDRLHELDEPARTLLELIAVAGDDGSLSMLHKAWQHEASLDTTLRRLRDHMLIAEHVTGSAVRYRVAHPLYAEVAYAELSANERARLHAAVAGAMPDDVLTVAPHYLRAGDHVPTRQAVEVLAAAGRRALHAFATTEAVEYLTVALDRAAPDQRLELLHDLGLAQQQAGRPTQAATAWSEGLVAAGRADDQQWRPRFLMLLAALEAERGDFSLADTHAEHGMLLAADQSDYVGLLRWALAQRHRDLAHIRSLSEQLAAVCGRDPADAPQSVARQSRGYLAVLHGDFALARRELEAAHEHAMRCGADAPELDYGARRILSGVCVLTGDVPAALHHAAAATESQFPAARGSMRFALAMVRYFAGDPLGALTEIEGGIADARAEELHRLIARQLTFAAFLLAELGRLDEAEQRLGESLRELDEPEFAFDEASELAATAIALHRGRPQDAPPLRDIAAFEDPLLGCARVLFAAQAAQAVGDGDTAAQLTGLMRLIGHSAPLVDACADRLAGFAGAADKFAAMGAPLLAAQARLEDAERNPTADAIADCLVVFERAGTKPWLERARRLARTHGLGALTRREAEIVRLVGEGLTNAAIAARLFLSERTVETHLRNGYKRLGITSRAALVEWVRNQVT